MAKKAAATTTKQKRPRLSELKRLAQQLGLLRGKTPDEAHEWVVQISKRPDPVAYLEGRAARRDAAEPPRPKRQAPTMVPNVVEPPQLPQAEIETILVELTIGPWHPDGYGVSQKNPPQRLRMPDRRLQAEQSHAIARLFNGAIAAGATMQSGRPIATKEDLVLHVLEQIGRAIEEHDRKAG